MGKKWDKCTKDFHFANSVLSRFESSAVISLNTAISFSSEKINCHLTVSRLKTMKLTYEVWPFNIFFHLNLRYQFCSESHLAKNSRTSHGISTYSLGWSTTTSNRFIYFGLVSQPKIYNFNFFLEKFGSSPLFRKIRKFSTVHRSTHTTKLCLLIIRWFWTSDHIPPLTQFWIPLAGQDSSSHPPS